MRKKTCLITGSSKGLGQALVTTYKQAGYEVIGVSRSLDVLVDSWIEADLSCLEGIEKVLNQIKTPLDVLICNAGVNSSGSFESTDFKTIEETIFLNLKTPMVMVNQCWKKGFFQKNANCILIASMACDLGYPGSSLYGSVKKGLAAFSDQLDLICQGHFKVMTVYPGPIDTDQARSNTPNPGKKQGWSQPEDVAKKILKAMEAGKKSVYPAPGLRTLAALCQFFPSLGDLLMKKSVWIPMQKSRAK